MSTLADIASLAAEKRLIFELLHGAATFYQPFLNANLFVKSSVSESQLNHNAS